MSSRGCGAPCIALQMCITRGTRLSASAWQMHRRCTLRDHYIRARVTRCEYTCITSCMRWDVGQWRRAQGRRCYLIIAPSALPERSAPYPAGIKDATNDEKSLPRTNPRSRHCLRRNVKACSVANVRGRLHRQASNSFRLQLLVIKTR